MYSLDDLTFIIPVKLDSKDRYFNLKTALGFLNNHFTTNIKINETTLNLVSQIDFLNNFKNLNIEHSLSVEAHNQAYHRTRYLNEMLNKTTTKLVANYDCDVIFPVKSLLDCYNLLLNTNCDFIYPYSYGMEQKQLNYIGWWEKTSINDPKFSKMVSFTETFDLNIFNNDLNITKDVSLYGFCVMAKTASYKKGYGENEDFISYGPEDKERAYRFQKLGFDVQRYEGSVYHMDHPRTPDSGPNNPFFYQNFHIYNYIQTLSTEELNHFYKNKNYLQKYNF